REVFSADFASHLVGFGLEVDLLAFGEPRKASPLDRADVNEDIIAAVVRLDKSKALLTVEPLNSTCRHFHSPKRTSACRVTITRKLFNFVDVFGKGARGRVQQGTAANRISSIYTAFSFFARKRAEIVSATTSG